MRSCTKLRAIANALGRAVVIRSRGTFNSSSGEVHAKTLLTSIEAALLAPANLVLMISMCTIMYELNIPNLIGVVRVKHKWEV